MPVFAVLSLVSLAIGITLGRRSPPPAPAAAPAPAGAATAATARLTEPTLHQAMTSILASVETGPREPGVTPEEIRLAILELEETPQGTADALRGDDSVSWVRWALLARVRAQEDPRFFAVQREIRNRMKENPDEAATQIARSLGHLDASAAVEDKIAVLSLAAETPEPSPLLRSAALEALRNPTLSVDDAIPSRALPAAAHAAFLRSAQSPYDAFQGTQAGLEAHEDAGIRATLVAQLIAAYPEFEEEFDAVPTRTPSRASR